MLLESHWDRTCDECRRWDFDDEEDSPPGRRGLPVLDGSGNPGPRVNDPPCRRCPKVPASVVARRQRTGDRVTPADALEPGPEHRLAVEHFLECVAVGRFPRDGWVRRHAALLRPLHQHAEQRPLVALADSIRSLVRSLPNGD